MSSLEQFRSKYPHLSDDAIADLADLSLRVSGSQKTRKGFLGLIKEVAPDTPIPEIEVDARIDARLKEEREAREKLEKQIADERFAAALGRQKDEARSKFGLSEDDMSKMEEMMKKGDLPADYRFAPALYRQQIEAATPTSYGGSGYGPFDLHGAAKEKSFEGLMEDADAWAQKTAHALIDEARGKKRESAF